MPEAIFGDAVATGISGLDRVLHGGYPQDGVLLIQDAHGTGRTIQTVGAAES